MESILKITFFLFSILFFSCKNEPQIIGLWSVKSVMAGDQEMTPNARWTKFNADFTQESGNGWFQHSIGTWKLDMESMNLSVENSNGVNDSNEPFTIAIEGNKMTWKRQEGEQTITVNLERIQKLPMTYGDQVLGLWELKEAEGEGNYFPNSKEDAKGTLFLKWDRRFDIRTKNGRITGVYNVHGHKPELELIPYGDQLERSFWKINFKEKQIDLTLLNSDSLVKRTFQRIHDWGR